MDVFFGDKKFVLLLEFDHDVDVHGALFHLAVVFDEAACEVGHFFDKLPVAIHQGHIVAQFVFDHQGHDAVLLGHLEVVRTKGGGDVYDSGTVLGAHEVAQECAEGRAIRLHVR